mmetsp:Transcript_33008/g.57801  ORF Transcript_33008/g.57801 Transcript_33008/m.57801 type:complete len:86 (+) Transcript_33008:422-679(+)
MRRCRLKQPSTTSNNRSHCHPAATSTKQSRRSPRHRQQHTPLMPLSPPPDPLLTGTTALEAERERDRAGAREMRAEKMRAQQEMR